MADFFEQFGGQEEAAEGGDFFAQFGGQAEAEEAPGMGESAYRGAVQGASLGFGDEVAAGFGAGAYGVAKGVRSLLPGGVPEGAPGVGEVYTQLRDQFRAENAGAEEANPITYRAGEVVGGVAGSGANPASVVRLAGSSLKAVFSREGAKVAVRSLLTPETAKAAGAGAAYGAASGAGYSEADTLEGVADEALGGAVTGAGVGAAARGLLAAGSQRRVALARSTSQKAATGRAVEEFDAATAALPEQQAAVKAANAEATAAAKLEGKAATKAKQAEAQAATREQTLANPLVRTGLEGKQGTLRGPKRARARAQALVDEPLPGDPSKKLVDEADKLAPGERLDFANALRSQEGAKLGAVRKELENTDATFSAEAIRAELRGAFGELPTEVQGRALETLEAQIGALAKDGALSPAALRKLIADAEAFTKFSTPSLEAALGNARGRVYQTARSVLVGNEQAAVAAKLPEARAQEYTEALRKYGVFSDFELGSDVMFRRANRGKATVAIPKAAKVEPEVRTPLLQPKPQAPQFPGGEAALAEGRKLLQPSALGQLATRAIAGEAGARLGAMLPVPGAALAGARIGDGAARLWTRITTPSVASLSAKAAKLRRLQPMMEEALAKGPAEVARIHALFMQRSPDYRKAIEAGE